jgi:chromosome segregation ATPase
MKSIKDDSFKHLGDRSEINMSLKEVREHRQKKLNSLLDMLSVELDKTYQDLTRKGDYVFGRANLFVNDKIEPFNSGIDYIPNPPGKRSIYSIQQLSSGEKTIALLAFQFTLLQHWNLPFMILDEADAHLDEPNIEKVYQYLTRPRPSTKPSKQCIFVSHKNLSIYRS